MVADLPGLIEGAAEGAGLGTRFLGHAERCAILLHLIDATAEDVAASYRTIRGELASYGGGLTEKPEVIGLNKIDALDETELAAKLSALAAIRPGAEIMALSGVSGAGVEAVLHRLARYVDARVEAAEAML